MDLGHFQIRIDFVLDAEELSPALQIDDTIAEIAILCFRSFVLYSSATRR
jgi:hypothetical protein